jgi:hypothetical protein
MPGIARGHLGAAHRRLVQHDLQPEAVHHRRESPGCADRIGTREHARVDALTEDSGEEPDPGLIELFGDLPQPRVAQRLTPRVDPQLPAVIARRRHVLAQHPIELLHRGLAARDRLLQAADVGIGGEAHRLREQIVFAREVVVDQSVRHLELGGNVVDARAGEAFGEYDASRRFEDLRSASLHADTRSRTRCRRRLDGHRCAP